MCDYLWIVNWEALNKSVFSTKSWLRLEADKIAAIKSFLRCGAVNRRFQVLSRRSSNCGRNLAVSAPLVPARQHQVGKAKQREQLLLANSASEKLVCFIGMSG